MWMQSPFITNQVYRLCFMAVEVKTVAFLCLTLPTETSEASVVPSHHQACQHKLTSLRGFCSLSVWSELRKTHVFQFRVGLAHNLSVFGVNCPKTSYFKDTGTLMDTAEGAAGNFIKAVATGQTSHSQRHRGASHRPCCVFAFPCQLSGKAETNIAQDTNIHMLCARVTHTHTHTIPLAKAGNKEHLLQSVNTSWWEVCLSFEKSCFAFVNRGYYFKLGF